MSDPILDKLDREWQDCTIAKDYGNLGKILRAKINLLKSSGSLAQHKDSLGAWAAWLESRLPAMELQTSLTLIGHLRHARKALSITSSDVGSAFRLGVSAKERARFRKRNRPPRLGVANRAELPEGFATGEPSHDLQSGSLGNGAS